MFIYLLILVTVLLKIFALPYIRPLIDSVTENGLRLSSMQFLLQGREISSSSRSSIQPDGLGALCENDNTDEDEKEEGAESQGAPTMLDMRERWGGNFDDDKFSNPPRITVESIHLNEKRAKDHDQSGKFAWEGEVVTDSAGTDNKYKGTKENILQALMESMEKSSWPADLPESLTAVGNLQADQVYSAVMQCHSPLRNNRKSKSTLNSIGENISSRDESSPLNDESSIYHECNPSSSGTSH